MNKKMVNMIFYPGYNMHFHVTYRSYTDGRPWGDVPKCSLQSLVFEINEVYAVYKQNNSDYELSEGDILNIQNLVLSGNYYFSSLRLVRTYSESPGSNLIPALSVEVEASLADEVVIGALAGILIKELGQSSYFSKSCYSSYSKDRTITHYLDTILEYRDVQTLLIVNCSNSELKFSRSRLIEKVRSIVNNDLVKLISSFCNAPIVDNMDRDFSINTGVPPLPFIAEVLFNIYMDDIDREIEKRLPKLKYARYQNEILIPIFDEEKEQSYCEVLNDIFINECNLLSPTLERAVRGGESIPFSGGFILINNEGKSKIKLELEYG
jgi:hypothetical protein